MPTTRNLKWLAVKVTPENKEELEALSDFPIDDAPYMSYGLHNNKYLPSNNLVEDTEKLIPDFSKLPEIRLLISLGMSNREAFNKIYGEPVSKVQRTEIQVEIKSLDALDQVLSLLV